MERYKKIERVTLAVIFLLTVPILVLAFINNSFDPFSGTNWVGNDVVKNIIPNGFVPYMFISDAIWMGGFHPGIPFLTVLGITCFILLPMSFNKRTSFTGAVGMMVSSYIFASFLWVYSLAWVSSNLAVTIIGLCFGYIGIIPIAFIEMLEPIFNGIVEPLVIMAVLIVLFIITRKLKNHALTIYLSADKKPVNTSSFWKATRIE